MARPRSAASSSRHEPDGDAPSMLAPPLRFPEFRRRAPWSAVNGDRLFEPIDRRPPAAGLPVLAITQEHGAIPRDQIDYHVSVTDASLASYKEVRPGDFIISLRSFQGGIEYSRHRGICSPAYVVLNRKGEGTDDFYRHLFKSERFIQQLTRNIEGLRDGKMISYKQFSEQLLPEPRPDEQQKIADCLTSLDECIAAQGRKVEALKAHKKGLMQALFPREGERVPRLRFPEFRDGPEWEIKPLASVAENLDGRRVPITEADRVKGTTPYYGASGIIDYVDGHLFDEELLCVSEDGANLAARTSPIAFSISGRTWVNNHAHVLRFARRATQVLVEAYLNETDLGDFLTGMAQPKLNRAKLDIIPIPLPEPTEQQRIADCLDLLDAAIAAASAALTTLKAHKKGLMQGLFPAATVNA